jgi:hypothetical protein
MPSPPLPYPVRLSSDGAPCVAPCTTGYDFRVQRDGFPGHDEPANIEGEPEDVLKTLLTSETEAGPADEVEPDLDE